MRIRYSVEKTEKEEKLVKKASVYTQDEHGISFADVDTEAVEIVARLWNEGFPTYIVGGAVRDLILGKKPKDFDIVSEANPAKIKKLFRNARIIGHRFRLVHVYYGEKLFEVSTFRSTKDGFDANTFGTIEEDVLRRDFSINALFYDPLKQIVVDYVGGMKDISKKNLRPLIPLPRIFTDDPVRMIRAVKYSTTTGFKIPLSLRWLIKKQASLLGTVSPSRLTEEILKIIHSPCAPEIVENLDAIGLYAYLQPETARLMKKNRDFKERYLRSLTGVTANNPPGAALAALFRDYLETEHIPQWTPEPEQYKTIFTELRQFLFPLSPPKIELDRAIKLIFKEHGVTIKRIRPVEREKKAKEPESGTDKNDKKPESSDKKDKKETAGKKARRRRPRKRRIDPT